MKILNLYAGIGGNRKLWQDVEVTAVEINPEIAAIYQDFFPNDKVIVGDAHEYLLKHFKEFDFIWSSPPCQTHSKLRFMLTHNEKFKRELKYPDMTLYQEIIFLRSYCNSQWVIENVNPYYEPLIKAQHAGRHLFWSNFLIHDFKITHSKNIKHRKVSDYEEIYGFDISNRQIKHRKDQLLRNCVNPELGKHIFDCAFNGKSQSLFGTVDASQESLFSV